VFLLKFLALQSPELGDGGLEGDLQVGFTNFDLLAKGLFRGGQGSLGEQQFAFQIAGSGLPSKGLMEPSTVVRMGNLKRFTSPLRNWTVHMMSSAPRSGIQVPPMGAKSA
jgi:hypothetical protein